ncbi:longitudinals lacking protein, isoforms A/B/D/L isoform X2 [Nilaparvata lugens]|uniref:longitudinals lacking protein, isoforms A/B/D/L isoform X2 n=1 Tax=Nilaparvata lugens TaxID=108931 RepID=UPI00193CD05A|nr:longitudinals lacking protein, isoforms A/B/D/L isoform X2 [Nilaparvata lugens]
MATDQHFCLRWNNHQSTLISVFDTLLESGTLVDCTLAADGQQLKAHKVVLSACSPYLEALLSQHYDKHPIIILRDVKFPELKAMLDYMYRGEVNITQEQLGTFLKAAESLQIKGLTDSGGGGGADSKRHDIRKQLTMPPAAVTPQTRPRVSGGNNGKSVGTAGNIPGHMMDTAPSSPLKAREGSVSPVVKKRRKPDHPQHNDDARLVQTATTDNGGGSPDPPTDEPPPTILNNSTPNNNNSWPPNNKASAVVDNSKEKTAAAALAAVKCESLLQPKAEYIDDDMNDNENSADEDDDEEAKMDGSKPGPSHGANTHGYQSWMEDDSSNEESGASNNQQNSQGYGPWHASTDGSADETMMTAPPQDSQDETVMMVTQEINQTLSKTAESIEESTAAAAAATIAASDAGAKRTPGGKKANKRSHGNFPCEKCGRMYLRKDSLQRHVLWECGKEPQFQCPFCPQKCKRKTHHIRHIQRQHFDMMMLLKSNENSSDSCPANSSEVE